MIQENNLDKPLPLGFMIFLPLYTGGILAVFIFPLSGDWSWLEGWLLCISFAVTMTIGFAWINKRNPRVLRNRMKTKKEGLTAATRKPAGSDWWIMPIMSVGFFSALMLPAWAHRQGWAKLPFPLEIASVAIMNIGLVIMLVAMLQNSYASKILDINQEQQLVNTGLYGKVRHPLYAGAILMIMALPLALGSWHGLIPAAVGSLCLVVRIKYEEEMLVNGMAGYQQYQQQVKSKLIPGIY
ncbi:MAG: isoprenylcysteine carboxylmethyltransferase family protein [Anaerolineales bacterium]|nr:isoprenylcysteine carboxylmethyltransferase family protein [Anaerolineales bacterium]